MSLSGAKLIPCNENSENIKEIEISSEFKKKSYTIGESNSCDFVIKNGGPVYCELCIDDFGRVIIRNSIKSPDSRIENFYSFHSR